MRVFPRNIQEGVGITTSCTSEHMTLPKRVHTNVDTSTFATSRSGLQVSLCVDVAPRPHRKQTFLATCCESKKLRSTSG